MPSFVPALYQILSESSGWPTLRDTYLGNFSGYLDRDRDLVPIANRQRSFLIPVSIGDWLELGRMGTPILTPGEVDTAAPVKNGPESPETVTPDPPAS
jgi:hypothetical protein